eukprot:Pgem_evm1s4612
MPSLTTQRFLEHLSIVSMRNAKTCEEMWDLPISSIFVEMFSTKYEKLFANPEIKNITVRNIIDKSSTSFNWDNNLDHISYFRQFCIDSLLEFSEKYNTSDIENKTILNQILMLCDVFLEKLDSLYNRTVGNINEEFQEAKETTKETSEDFELESIEGVEESQPETMDLNSLDFVDERDIEGKVKCVFNNTPTGSELTSNSEVNIVYTSNELNNINNLFIQFLPLFTYMEEYKDDIAVVFFQTSTKTVTCEWKTTDSRGVNIIDCNSK